MSTPETPDHHHTSTSTSTSTDNNDTASTVPDLPRRLVNTRQLAARAEPGTAGAIWRLEEPVRDLDSNIIALPSGDGIDAHQGPDNDVMIQVIAGSGTLGTADGDLDLQAGDLLWMPRRSMRRFSAGGAGLTYHTVHVKKPGLQLRKRRPDDAR